MRLRRKRLLSVLRDDEICPTLTVFPLLGVDSFTDPELPAGVRIEQALMDQLTRLSPLGAVPQKVSHGQCAEALKACPHVLSRAPCRGQSRSPTMCQTAASTLTPDSPPWCGTSAPGAGARLTFACLCSRMSTRPSSRASGTAREPVSTHVDCVARDTCPLWRPWSLLFLGL